MKKTIIFLHIPKTAGTSFARILRENYFLWPKPWVYWEGYPAYMPKPIQDMSLEDRKKLKVIHGHLSFGIHELLDQPFSYVAFLRDPMKRMLSYYDYILATPGHYLHEEVCGKKMSLKEFVLSGVTKEIDNLQVRMLHGPEKAIPFGEVNEYHLDLAKQNIKAHFPVVGLTEYFDESLLLMRNRLWKFFPFYVRANVAGKEKVHRDVPDEETLTLIRENNRYDQMLYDWAKDRLFCQIEEAGSGFDKRVERFRRINRLFGSGISCLPIYKRC